MTPVIIPVDSGVGELGFSAWWILVYFIIAVALWRPFARWAINQQDKKYRDDATMVFAAGISALFWPATIVAGTAYVLLIKPMLRKDK